MIRWLQPPRLDAPESPATQSLRGAIRELRALQASPDDVEALRRRLEAASIAVSASGASDSSMASSSSTKLHAVRSGLTLMVFGIVGVGAWLSLRSATPAPPAPPSLPPADVEPAAEPASPPPSEPALAPPLETAETQREPTPAASDRAAPSRSIRRRHPRPEPVTAVRSPADELALIGRAQAALDRRPDRTLQLLAEHARDYPQGNFVQEREMLWMEAQLKLGAAEQVYPRAARFLSRYPHSTHAPRVRALLDAHADAAASSVQN